MKPGSLATSGTSRISRTAQGSRAAAPSRAVKSAHPLRVESVRLGEALGVAHVGPDVRLDVGPDLLDVVAVVVDPLVEQVVYPQRAHLGMRASLRQVCRAERGHQ